MINEPLLGMNPDPGDPDDEEAGSVNLERLTKAELIDYAAGHGIDLNMRMTKSNMIAEIGAE